MYRYLPMLIALAVSTSCVVGCGVSTETTAAIAPPIRFRLANEPAGAIGVLEAKDQARNGEPIVVVGRLGGGPTAWVDGRAAFLLVDTLCVPSCDEKDDCGAGCPDCARELTASSAMVKFVGADGKILPTDARELLGVKAQDTVVVQGVANRDAMGNVSVAADGIYIRR